MIPIPSKLFNPSKRQSPVPMPAFQNTLALQHPVIRFVLQRCEVNLQLHHRGRLADGLFDALNLPVGNRTSRPIVGRLG